MPLEESEIELLVVSHRVIFTTRTGGQQYPHSVESQKTKTRRVTHSWKVCEEFEEYVDCN